MNEVSFTPNLENSHCLPNIVKYFIYSLFSGFDVFFSGNKLLGIGHVAITRSGNMSIDPGVLFVAYKEWQIHHLYVCSPFSHVNPHFTLKLSGLQVTRNFTKTLSQRVCPMFAN